MRMYAVYAMQGKARQGNYIGNYININIVSNANAYKRMQMHANAYKRMKNIKAYVKAAKEVIQHEESLDLTSSEIDQILSIVDEGKRSERILTGIITAYFAGLAVGIESAQKKA